MSTPDIDVVMPVYNAELYLEDSVLSILHQTYQNFRLLAVDDGSTDGSTDILRRLAAADGRIQHIRQENRGLVGALNAGLDHASAPLIARMDADDIAFADRFARQRDFLNAHPDVVAVGTAILEMDSDGDPLGTVSPPTEHKQIENGMMKLRMGLAHPSVMMRTAAVKAAGGYRSEFEWVEDIDLWLRLAETGRLANVPDVLLCYRQHVSSGSWSVGQVRRERTVELIRQAYERRGRVLPDEVRDQCQRARSSGGPMKWARKASKNGLWRVAMKHTKQQWSDAPLSPFTWRMTAEVLARASVSTALGGKGKLPEIPRAA